MEQKKELTRDERQLLLHIPHSSTSFPATTGHSFKDLDEEERLLIDYYTDELFAPRVQTSGIASAVFIKSNTDVNIGRSAAKQGGKARKAMTVDQK